MFFSKSPTFAASQLSIMMNLLSPSMILSRLFSRKPCATVLTGLSPSFCWFAKSLASVDQAVTDSVWRRVCSKHFGFSAVRAVFYDQDSVRGLPIVLSDTCRTPPVALLRNRAQKRPTRCCLQAGIDDNVGTHTTK